MISLNFSLAAQFARTLSCRCLSAGLSSLTVLLVIILLHPANTLASTDGALILERANSNENIYRGGELVSHLRGNVVFRYEDMRISSDEATWWKNAGRVDFRKKVRVERSGDIMTCDRMLFVRDRNLLTAAGQFFYQDSAEVTFLSGNEAEYSTDKKIFQVKGKPLLVRKEHDDDDTLFIRGRVMIYNDSLKIAAVKDSVRITKGNLSAACKNAEYFTSDNAAYLRILPEVFYEGHRVVGDSIDLHFGKETLKSARVVGNSHGRYTEASASSNDTSVTHIWSDSLLLTMSDSGKGHLETMRAFGKVHGRYAEISPSAKDTSITHIWSDSLLLTMSDSGKLDSMQAFGKVLSRYFAAGDSARANEVSGRTMTLRFSETGKIEKALIWGNAKSTYYIDESDGGGRNEASGDQIIVRFALGRARLLHLKGNARGTYFPNIN
ncbi:MAG: hypothetical protein LBB56_05545 [Chitinispirillales bacterium]|jgi:lipopolysaccharide export system protein LptA|nr:hypothetical protein [Chitinispirillales bacterium]